MSSFRIDTDATLACKDAIDVAETNLRRYSIRVSQASQTIGKVMSGASGQAVRASLSRASERLLDRAVRMDSLGNALLTIVRAYEDGDESATELVKSLAVPSVDGSSGNKEGSTEGIFTKTIKAIRDFIKWVISGVIPQKTPEQIAKEREKANDLAMQKAVFALRDEDRFSEKTWKKASLEERKQILREFVAALAVAMGIHEPGSVEFSVLDENTRGFYSYENDMVAINESYLTNKDSYAITQTVIHEMRHAYQHEVVDHPENFQVTEETVEAWRNNFDNYRGSKEYGYDSYVTQPIEWDAKNFARQKRDVRHYKPDYAGSW